MIRLLLSSVGSLVGTNVIESVVRLGRERFHLVGLNSEAEAANNFACDRCVLVPPVADEAGFVAAVDAVAAGTRPQLVIPCRDDDVVVLARWAERTGQPVLAGASRVAAMMRDKWASFEWATARGLPFADSAVTLEGARALLARWGLPLIAKPLKGDGSRGVRVLTRPAQLEALFARDGVLVQPLLAPPAQLDPWTEDGSAGMPLWYAPPDRGQYVAQALVLPDGSAEMLATTINTMVCGMPQHTVWVDEPALSALGLVYARALAAEGWRGPVNLQCRKIAEGQFVPFELGGRFGGATGLRDTLGAGEVARVLSAFVPGVALDDPRPPERGGVAVKQPQSVLLRAGDVAGLRSEGRWPAFG